MLIDKVAEESATSAVRIPCDTRRAQVETSPCPAISSPGVHLSSRRWMFAVVAVTLLVLVALGVYVFGWPAAPSLETMAVATASPAIDSSAPPAVAAGTVRGALPALPEASEPAADDTGVAALQARDERRRAAIGRFHGVMLAELNRCLPQRPGPRSQQQLVVHFERVEAASADPAHPAANEAFRVRGVEPIGVPPGQPSPRDSAAWACFEGLSGTKLEIPKGAGRQPAQFRELLTLPLPASVGWAHVGAPGARVP